MNIKNTIHNLIPRFAINRFNMLRDTLHIKEVMKNPPKPYAKGAKPLGINLYGDYVSGTGLSRSLNLLLKDLEAADIPHSTHQVTEVNGLPENEDGEQPDYAVNVFHVQPARMPALFGSLSRGKLDGHVNIAYWLWETPDFPPEWVPLCDYFDELWTPSVFIAKALRKETDKPIRVYPCAVASDVADVIENREQTRQKYGIPQDAFAPMIIYDRRSGSERKNPDAAIKAFHKAFNDKEEKVCLIIKAKSLTEDDLNHLKSLLDNDERYVIIHEFLSHEETQALLACSDVLLSLHRAEGFGLPVAEMMSLGGVALSTDYSSTKEFINETNGCPVVYRLIRTKKDYSVYRAGTIWAEPDIDDAADKLRKLYEDPELRKKLGEEARKSIYQELSAEVVGNRIRKRVESICREIHTGENGL